VGAAIQGEKTRRIFRVLPLVTKFPPTRWFGKVVAPSSNSSLDLLYTPHGNFFPPKGCHSSLPLLWARGLTYRTKNIYWILLYSFFNNLPLANFSGNENSPTNPILILQVRKSKEASKVIDGRA